MADCKSWNPYYTNEVIETDTISKEHWRKRNVPLAEFNQDLLKKYNCEYFNKELATPEDCDAWWKTLGDVDKKRPQDIEEYEHTHKMLHYTLIFQIFVFM